MCRAVYGPLATKTVPARFMRYAKGPYVTGSENLRHDGLLLHDKSEGHGYAVTFKQNRGKPTGESIGEKTVQTLNKATYSKLEKLFRSAHALAKKSRPISDFVWQCELDTKRELR